MSYALPLDIAPMEARAVGALPCGPGWRFEPKWDGFRCLVFKSGADAELKSKSGKSLSRYFPEMVRAVRDVPLPAFVVDGELTVPLDGKLSFDALQARLHPAESRIRRLSAETPARLILFDCLATAADGPLLDTPLNRRKAGLEAIAQAFADPRVRLTRSTLDRAEAQRWLDGAHGDIDGVVAKRDDGPYLAGERAMQKVKRLRTADCVVGGFRYATGTPVVGSLLLGLYNDAGRLDHVGFTSAISAADRPALTARLEGLAGSPGFDGNAPGGPSRWSTERSTDWHPIRPELVVEVRYDQVTGGRFRHGTGLVRWRPDKTPRQCRSSQLEAETDPATDLAAPTRAAGD